MKTLRKWNFLLMLAAMGAVFFTLTGTWDVMGRPYVQAKEWVQGLREAGARFPWEGDWDAFRNNGGFWSLFGNTASGADGGSVSGGGPGVSGKGSVSGNGGGAAAGGITGSGNSAERNGGVTGEAGGAGQGSGDAGGETGGSGNGAETAGSGIGGTAAGGITGSGNSAETTGGGTGNAGGAAGSENTGAADGEAAGSGAAPGRPEDVAYVNVEDDYFRDALFIGDSRTVGMFEYGGLEEISTFYASTGLTVYKMFDSPIVSVPGQKQKRTIEEALSEEKFSKIYLMIGINEMGTGTVDTFMEKYREAVTHLRELQPDAVIYLQAIMKVTTKRSEQGDYINNEGIDVRNAEIAKLADYRRIFYLDVNPLICDETGGMEPSYTYDGVHLKAQYIPIWKEFLKQRAVVLD